jgi:hypothetical protein
MKTTTCTNANGYQNAKPEAVATSQRERPPKAESM